MISSSESLQGFKFLGGAELWIHPTWNDILEVVA